MRLSSSSLLLKLAFLGGYPILSILFAVLGLEGLWSPWAIIAASFVFFFVGLHLGNLVQRHPSFRSSTAPYVFLTFALLGILFLAAFAGGRQFLYAGLGFLIDMFLTWLVYVILEGRDLLESLKSHRTYIWFVFILSAALPTYLGLEQLNHGISLTFIIIYGAAFGLFGPEVIRRVARRRATPLLLTSGYFFLTLLLYNLLEIVNPNLKYLALEWLVVLSLSYLAGYTMLVSRCVLEAFEGPEGQKE